MFSFSMYNIDIESKITGILQVINVQKKTDERICISGHFNVALVNMHFIL